MLAKKENCALMKIIESFEKSLLISDSSLKVLLAKQSVAKKNEAMLLKIKFINL